MLLTNQTKTDSKILIVDDNMQNVLVLKHILQGCGDLHFSESAKDALVLIEKIPPDIILLDIEMPEMDGWEMFRRLKKNQQHKNIPVIFITSHDEPQFEIFSLELGGVDFITKPFNPEICRVRVQNLLKLQNQSQLIIRGREQIQQLVKQVPVLISYWDKDWNLLFSNSDNVSWFDSKAGSGDNQNIDDSFPGALSEAIKSKDVSLRDLSYSVQVKNRDVDLHYQVYQSLLSKSSNLEGFLVTIVDISETKQAKQDLQSEKERLRVTLNSIGDSVIATDCNGNITFMNPIAERMTGFRYKRAKGQKIDEIMELRDSESHDKVVNPIFIALRDKRTVAMALNCELVSQDGYVYSVEDSAAPIKNDNGDIIGAIMVFHDVSEVMAMALKMSHLANHDQLTDLPNRILLQDRIIVACQKAESLKHKVGVILLDIDNFKYINDTRGHQVGDDLICQLADRLKTIIPESATLARLGGDEFVILTSDFSQNNSPSLIANAVLSSLILPFDLLDQSHSASVSIGISVYPDDAKDAEQLMHHADVAMYRSKQEGRNRYSYFSYDLANAVKQRYQVETEIKSALSNDRVLVYFQPKFDLNTKKIIGAEALVRLKNETGEVIFPDKFIAIAEESGLISALGKQVLYQSCMYLRKLLDLGYEIPISVNVASTQFTSVDFEGHIVYSLKSNEVPSRLLELEITETAIMLDAEQTQKKLKRLKRLGIKIAIDDFGTGYSSLSYLKKFNVDVMKIDMSFVKDMLYSKQDYEIVKTIVSLGRSLGLTLVAEGVETQKQSDALLKIGCEIGQGYILSKPVTFDEFLKLLQVKSYQKL